MNKDAHHWVAQLLDAIDRRNARQVGRRATELSRALAAEPRVECKETNDLWLAAHALVAAVKAGAKASEVHDPVGDAAQVALVRLDRYERKHCRADRDAGRYPKGV